jgi:hypothetical protein
VISKPAFVLVVVLAACSPTSNAVLDADATIVDMEAKIMEHEEAIGECMREQGFDYVASLPPDWIIERAAMKDRALGGDGLVDIEPPPDPNQELLNQLSPTQLTAYETAYWGDADYGGENPGCYLGTFEETWELDPFEDTTEIDIEIQERIKAHPDIIEAEAAYVRCMASQGRELTSYEGAYSLADQGWLEGWPEEDAVAWERDVYADHEECQPAYDDVYAPIQQEIVADYYP